MSLILLINVWCKVIDCDTDDLISPLGFSSVHERIYGSKGIYLKHI